MTTREITKAARPRLHWRRALLATTAALSFGQNAAWAVCADGSTFPAGGYQIGVAPAAVACGFGGRTALPGPRCASSACSAAGASFGRPV